MKVNPQKHKRKLTTLIAVLCLFFYACTPISTTKEKPWKTIEIGDYLFDFPSEFEIIREQGIDSYVGKIQSDSVQIIFDFGYYSGDFAVTEQEYLANGSWKSMLHHRFMKEGVIYDQTNIPKVDVLNIRTATSADSSFCKTCDYIAHCKHENIEFDFAIDLPAEIKRMNFSIDTIGHYLRKIVYSKDSPKGTIALNIKDINGFNKNFNAYLTLSLFASELTKQKQHTVLKIFKTGRHKSMLKQYSESVKTY